MSANEEIQEIHSYFRSECFTEIIEDAIHQHIGEGFSRTIK